MEMLNATGTTVIVTRFHVVDYVIFILMLCVSVAIGFYFACSGGKQKTASEYLMGNRNVGKFPIAMSLLASFMSSIAMLGMPSEIYTYGVGFWYVMFGVLLAIPAAGFLFMPVFYELQLTSTIEYVERRFNKFLRYTASLLFIIAMTIYAAFVIYGPAIALRQVTGINIWGSIVTIGCVGTLYTSMGGLKAVVWTDVVQGTLMLISLTVLCIKGTYDVGGFLEMTKINLDGERLYPLSFSADPRIRYTFWGCLIANFIGWCTIYGVYQPQVQRYLSAPSKKDAKKSLWWNIPGLIILYSLCCYIGLILYAKYHGCDPLVTKQLDAPDQIAPLFVMETMSAIPGLPGLFVAGVFSGSLSTVSSVFNSLAAIVLEDFVRQTARWKNITEEKAATASKLIALSFGLLSFLLASLGDFLGSVIQSSTYNINVFTAVYFGIFLLGLFFPWATAKGTTVGVFCGLAMGLWISIGTQRSAYVYPRPPISIDECPLDVYNATYEDFQKYLSKNEEDIFELYKISYLWMSPFVAGIVVIVGLASSYILGANGINDVNPRYLSPATRYFLKLFHKSKYTDGKSFSVKDVNEELLFETPQVNGILIINNIKNKKDELYS